MNGRERWFALALHAYPRAYRAERGGEMMATLIESTETASWWSVGADGLDLVVQGMRVRMALGSDRYAGRVLMLAALPGFVMAAAFAMTQLVLGEVAPALPTVFGPFQTVGAVVYLVWIAGALGALARPRHQRPLVAVCILVTIVSVPVGDAFSGRPLLRVLMVLVGLGLPGLFAPSPDWRSRRCRTVAAGAGVVTLSLLVPCGVAASDGIPLFGPFSPMEMFRLAQYLPYVAAAGAAVAVALVVVHRTDWIGAGALVLAPWFAAGAAGPYWGKPLGSSDGFDVFVLCVIVTWLGATWVRDLRTQQLSGGTGESGHLG